MRGALLLVAVALLAAGCTGKPDQPAAQAIQALSGAPSAEELAHTPGQLGGTVTTPSLAPIPGATLAIERLGLNVTADASGLFLFDAVPAGDHEIVAAAKGFATKTLRTSAVNGSKMQIDIVLTPAAAKEPYVDERELKGFLSCGLLVRSPQGDERRDCASADPNHRDAFEVMFDSDVQGAVFELAWDASANPAAKTLRLVVETVGYGSLDAELGNTTGDGSAIVRVEPSALAKYYPEGGLMRARIELEGEPAAAALQTTYTLYVSGFYHAPAPDGYSAIKG